jgi:long-subunit fatty acid transport protein
MTILKRGASALVLGAICLFPLVAEAQTNGSNSPYSRYGFGLLSDRAQGFNKGMSGLAYGMRNGTELNMKNPASYASIDSLTFLFDVGFSLQNANLNQNGSKVNAHNTSYDYLSLGFRASERLGMSLGLMPYSTIGYSFSSSEAMADNRDITQTNTYSGDGGLHEVYAGIGWNPFKPVFVGMNVGYLWGEVTNTVLASFSQTTVASRRRQYTADIRSYKLNFGFQYAAAFDKNNRFVLGAAYELGHDIRSNGYYYDQTIQSSTTEGDTLVAKNAYALPHSVGVGFSWKYKEKLSVGVDYNWQQWSTVKSPTLVDAADGGKLYTSATGSFTDMHKVTVGAEYVADPAGLHWRERVRYRVGFSYTSPYTKVNGVNGPKDYLVSAGVALPIINTYNNRSLLNISAQYERVKPQVAGMISEHYLRLCIGLSFNERWFMKWKVE